MDIEAIRVSCLPQTVAAKNSRPTAALALLLGINLFNYIDRYVLQAVEPKIRHAFFSADDRYAMSKTGLLSTAFLFSYMLLAPVFGWLADRFPRWTLIGASVALWSLASGGTGLAPTFAMLLLTRVFVGVGEAGYGPAAPTIIADLFPVERRGRMLSYFYLAMPVGGALGYVLGGKVDAWLNWHWSFYVVVPPGLLLAGLCFFFQDPRKKASKAREGKANILASVRALLRIKSYVWNTGAMMAMTFAIGGMSFAVPRYVSEYRAAEFPGVKDLLAHVDAVFGGITAAAGLFSTLLGGWVGDRLRPRFPNAYFLVSGVGMLVAFPATVAMLFAPFPWAWGCLFLAVFFLFFNTGPSNTALANVTPPGIRASAFALNILAIHAFGDAISPPLIGWMSGRWNMNAAFAATATIILLASAFWFWGARYLEADTAAVELASASQ